MERSSNLRTPSVATQSENNLKQKKLRNGCSAGITELLDQQLNPLTEASNLTVFNKEVIEKRVILQRLVYDLPPTVSFINITTCNIFMTLLLGITGKTKCSIVTYYILFS